MRGFVVGLLLATVGIVAGSAHAASAQTATISVTREENQPRTVEIEAGQEVQFVNNTGGNAHVMFAGQDRLMFYVGKTDSRVKFEKPGTYDYTVHVSGVKGHAHTGRVVVK